MFLIYIKFKNNQYIKVYKPISDLFRYLKYFDSDSVL